MIFDLNNQYDRETFKNKVNDMYSKRLIVELKKVSPKRSIKQNSYLHLILSFFASETGYSLDDVKYGIFKGIVNKDLFKRTKAGRRGEIEYTRSSSDLTAEEMTLAITRFRDYSSSVAGIYIPSPSDSENLVHIQRQVERDREFILGS